MSIEERIKEIMSRVLAVQPDIITEDSGVGDLPNWDSLNHLRIISEVEKAFEIQFTPDVLMDIEDFSDLVNATETRV